MKVSALRDLLSLFNDDLEVLIQVDAEGNGYHKAEGAEMAYADLSFDYNIEDVRDFDEVGAEESWMHEVIVIYP